jgi:hypothetical protein
MKSTSPALAMKSTTPALRATPSPTKGNEKPLFPFIFEGVPKGRGSCFEVSVGQGSDLRKIL